MDFLLLGLLVAAIPFVLPIASWVSARRTRRLVEELAATLDEQGRTIDGLKAQLAQLRRQMTESPVAPPQAAVAPAAGAPSVAPASAPAPAPSVAPPPSRPAVERPPDAVGGAGAARRAACRTAAGRGNCSAQAIGLACRSRCDGGIRDCGRGCDVRVRGSSATAAATYAAAAGSTRAADAGVRLGEPRRRQAVLGDRRHRARVRRRVLPALLDRARLAAAAGPRGHRHPRRDCAARRLRAEGGAPLPGDRERDGRRGDRDPLRDVLRRARALEPDSRARHVRAARRSSRRSRCCCRSGASRSSSRCSACSAASRRRRCSRPDENRPIPLFAYLLLLNVGLAWVAYRQTWPVLTVLTLVLTTLYQWGWVFKFLDASSCRWRWASSSCSRWRRSPA